MRRSLLVFAICSTPWITACGSSPTAPSTPPPPSSSLNTDTAVVAASSIAVTTPGDMLVLGASETLTATATMTDRSTRVVSHGSWRSRDESVAIVNAGGTVTAVGTGETSVVVAFGGVEAATRIAVRADYQGVFTGHYVVTDCTSTGDFASFHVCTDMFPINSDVPYNVTFNLTQDGSQLSGAASFDTLSQTLSPTTIAHDGSARTTSHLEFARAPIAVAWNLTQVTPGRIGGTMVMVWTHPVRTGTMTVTTELRDVARDTKAAGVRAARGGAWRSLTEIWGR